MVALSRAFISVCLSVFSTEKYSMYDGSTRKPIIAIDSTTAATKTKPTMVRPDCLCRLRMLAPVNGYWCRSA